MWSLVVGIVSLFLSWLLPGVAAIWLGTRALRTIARTGAKGRGMAIAGIVLGSLGVAWSLVVLVLRATGSLPAF